MDLVQLKIIRTIATTRYGNLSHGDVLRTDAAFARHLVEDCQAAKYIAAAPAQPRKPRKAKP